MACCPKGIFTPLVLDCSGNTVKMPFGGLLRSGDSILGADIMSITVSTTLTTNAIVFVDCTAGNIIVTLPPAAIGSHFVIKRIDGSANTITVDGDGSETIDNVTTKTLPSQYDAIHIVSDGTEWWII